MLRKKKFFIVILVAVIAFGTAFAYKAGRTINVITNSEEEFWEEVPMESSPLLEPEKDRIDILVVGIRGYDGKSEWGNGEWLADTIILSSFHTLTKQTSIVSIPRDLYVDIPKHGKDKINSAYAIGQTRNPDGGGLQLMKIIVSSVTGVYVDHAVSIDFQGFQKTIDQLGGVTIYRDTPFVEAKQWLQDGREGKRYWGFNEGTTTTEAGWEFYVPRGTNLMNSEEALYYARSRYSSSDFDRMRRQQELVNAVKSKALSLGVLANPVKIFNILGTLEHNVRTDMSLMEMKDLIGLIQEARIHDFKKLVLDSSENGLLIEDKINGMYVLLPKTGDYLEIQKLVKEIVQ